MLNKIKNKITEYLGFDVDKLLNQGDFVTIFGGAVRDSIADLEIHDIDVLCLGESMRSCDLFLQSQDYILDIDAYKNGFSDLYKELRVVHEPHSYIKIIEGKIYKVQLIKPWVNFKSKFEGMKIHYDKLLKNVDLTCCGVSIDRKGFTEHYDHAVVHCRYQVYAVVEDALMKTNRINDRTAKLNGRGWDDINGLLPKKKRDKLELILKQESLNKKIKKIKIIA